MESRKVVIGSKSNLSRFHPTVHTSSHGMAHSNKTAAQRNGNKVFHLMTISLNEGQCSTRMRLQPESR
jgi:hypothetical protein